MLDFALMANEEELNEHGRTLEEELLANLKPIDPVKVPFHYKIGILCVAILTIILPISYVALVAGNGYLLYQDWVVLAKGGPDSDIRIWTLIMWSALFIFTIKPIFSFRGGNFKPYELKREEEPLLHAYVDRLCDVVGAPRPTVIRVDCQVNASASFKNTFSIFGNNLVLTIGLPLVAGLNLREFTGVLAHEFGHFAQGSGMRLTYLVRLTMSWLARVVYYRDRLDEWLVRWSRGGDIRVMLILNILRFGVFITRCIMWFFLKTGEIFSCFMLRQMEYDADRYETRMAGCDAFKSTALKLPELNVAANYAFSDLANAWADKRLADNFPRLILENRKQITEEILEDLRRCVLEEKTSLLATHPADADRIASSAKERTDGVFQLEGDAQVLFSDFDDLCTKATYVYYEAVFDEPIYRKQLVDTDELVDREKRRAEGHKCLTRYFMEVYAGDHPPVITPAERERFTEAEAPVMFAKLQSARLEMEEAKLGLHAYLDESGSREAAMHEIQARGGSMARWRDKHGNSRGRNSKDLFNQFEKASRIRFLAGLALARDKDVHTLLEDREKLKTAAFRLSILSSMGGIMDIPQQMRKNLGVIDSAFEALQQDDSNQVARNRALRAVKDLYGNINEFYRALRPIRFPYTHGSGDINLAEYACDARPNDSEDFGVICHCAGTMLDRFFSLYFRIFGELVLLAEAAEEAIEKNELWSEEQVAEAKEDAEGMPKIELAGPATEAGFPVAAAVPKVKPKIKPKAEQAAPKVTPKVKPKVSPKVPPPLPSEPEPEPEPEPEEDFQDLSQLYPPQTREGERRQLNQDDIDGDPEEVVMLGQALERYSHGIAEFANPLWVTTVDWQSYQADDYQADLLAARQALAESANIDSFRRRLMAAIHLLDPETEGLQDYVELLLNLSAFLPRVNAVREALSDADLTEAIYGELLDLDARLLNIEFPFCEPPATLADFAIDALPAAGDGEGIHEGAQILVHRMLSLHNRVLGGLCALGEAVERALDAE